MDADFSDGSRLDDFWRAKLEEAQRRYVEDRTEESRAEYRRVLRIYANLVLRGKMPPSIE
jgi:hypothetical protein